MSSLFRLPLCKAAPAAALTLTVLATTSCTQDNLFEPLHFKGETFALETDPSLPEGAPLSRNDKAIQEKINALVRSRPDEPVFAEELLHLVQDTDACVEQATTLQIRHCLNSTLTALDFALEHNYQIILRHAGKEEARELRDFQAKWIKDRETYSLQALLLAWDGTLGPVLVNGRMIDWAQSRCDELAYLAGMVKDPKSNSIPYEIILK